MRQSTEGEDGGAGELATQELKREPQWEKITVELAAMFRRWCGLI